MKKLLLLIFIAPALLFASESKIDQARNFARSKNWQAVVTRTEITETSPGEAEDPVLDLIYGYALQQNGKDEDSLEPLTRSGDANSPISNYALYYKSEALYKLGRKDEAEQNLKRITDRSYIYFPARFLLARIYLDTSRGDEASTEISLLKDRKIPNSLAPELALLDADISLARGNSVESSQKLVYLWINFPMSDPAKELASAPPLTAEQSFERSAKLMQAGCFRGAREELEKLLADRDKAAPVISELFGRLAKARFYCRDYRAVICLEPQARICARANPEFWFYLAWSYNRLDQEDAAKKVYAKVARDFRNSEFAALSLYHLSHMELEKKHFWAAQEYLHELLRVFPEGDLSEDARFESGLLYFHAKNYSKTIEMFSSAPANAKDPARFVYWLYQSFEKAGQSENAAQEKNYLLKQFPTSAYAYLIDPCPSQETIAKIDPQVFPNGEPNNYKTGLLLAWAGLFGPAQAELRWQIENNTASKDELIYLMDQLERFQAYALAFELYRNALSPRLAAGEAVAYFDYLYPLAFQELVIPKAEKYNLDPAFVYALIRQESAFDPGAVSSAGALGLTQVMPFLARKVSRELGQNITDPEDFYDPDLNLEMGFYHLSKLEEMYKDAGPYPWPLFLTIAAYNAGSKPAEKWFAEAKKDGTSPDLWMEQIPYSETRGYLKKVLASMRIYSARVGSQARHCP